MFLAAGAMLKPETTIDMDISTFPLITGNNGNAAITLYDDGTRVIDYPGEDPTVINLEYPLNIDIKLSSRCVSGLDPRTKKAVCSFCHESARTDGIEGDYRHLEQIISKFPLTTEIALGINEVTSNLVELSETSGPQRILKYNQRSGYAVSIVNVDCEKGINIQQIRSAKRDRGRLTTEKTPTTDFKGVYSHLPMLRKNPDYYRKVSGTLSEAIVKMRK